MESWKLVNVSSLWWNAREGLPSYMSCRVLLSQVMQLLLVLHCKTMMLDFGIYVLGIWVRTGWLNWAGYDFLMDRVLVNWNSVSNSLLGNRRELNSPQAFTTRMEHLITYILITGNHQGYLLKEMLTICRPLLMIFPKQWVFFLKQKNDVFTRFKKWKTVSKKQTSK